MAVLRPLSQVIPPLIRQSLGKKGAHLALLLTHWSAVMGEALAATSIPIKLTFPRGRAGGALLTIQAAGAAAVVLQHDAPVILGRINAVFGYQAVERINFIQAPMRKPSPKPVKKTWPDASTTAHVQNLTRLVEDESLRQAITALGTAIAAKK